MSLSQQNKTVGQPGRLQVQEGRISVAKKAGDWASLEKESIDPAIFYFILIYSPLSRSLLELLERKNKGFYFNKFFRNSTNKNIIL